MGDCEAVYMPPKEDKKEKEEPFFETKEPIEETKKADESKKSNEETKKAEEAILKAKKPEEYKKSNVETKKSEPEQKVATPKVAQGPRPKFDTLIQHQHSNGFWNKSVEQILKDFVEGGSIKDAIVENLLNEMQINAE